MNSLRLDWCSHEAAKYAVEHWHYSRKLPAGDTIKVGVWESDAFIGCVIFSRGSSGVASIGKRFGLKTIEVGELARVALSGHVAPVTRIISIALRFLKKHAPGIKVLASYADPKEGHIGGIYQAGNWYYTGLSAKDYQYIDKRGRAWHSRTVSDTGFKVQYGVRKRCLRPSEMRRVELPPKYRYLYPMWEDMRNAIKATAKPYPKRVASETIDTATVQVDKGGETPTATLQAR